MKSGEGLRRLLLATFLVLAVSSTLATGDAGAQARFEGSINDFGGIGLIQTRNARFGAGGRLVTGISAVCAAIDGKARIAAAAQAMPGLEADGYWLLD